MISLDEMLAEEEAELKTSTEPTEDTKIIESQVSNDDNSDDNSDGDEDDNNSEEFEAGDLHKQKSSEEPSKTVDPDAEAYFNFLKVENVLDVPDDFEFKGDSDSIKEALELTKQNLTNKVARQIWENLPDDFKPLLEYGLSGGTDLNEYLNAVKVTDVESLDLSDDISRRAVIKSYYKILNPKLNEDQIDKRIDRLTEIADLQEEAEDALAYLKTHKEEQKQALILEAKAKQEAQMEALRNELQTYNKLIEEYPEFDVNRKNRIKSFLFTPIDKNNNTAFETALDSVYENPQHKIQLANILADYDPKLGFNFERLQKNAQKKVTQSFKELINSKTEPKSQIKGTSKPSKEDFDWDKFFKE